MRGSAGESTSGYHGEYEQLHELIERHALLHGDYVLSSDQSTSFYFDSKLVTLDPVGARLVGQAFIDTIAEHAPTASAVGGLTLGADPIISSIALLSGISSIALLSGKAVQPLKGLIVRKEPKSHGTKRWVEGPISGITDVVVVDDVVTSGNSAKLAVDRLRKSGMRVVFAIALIDRLAGFEQVMAQMRVPSTSIFTKDDFARTAGPVENTRTPQPDLIAI